MDKTTDSLDRNEKRNIKKAMRIDYLDCLEE
jgi:hypothetical protein